jgi:VanZ family protein
MSRTLSLWLPVVLWAAVIFALSSIPSLSTDLGLWDLVLRKAAHVTEYAILGALLLRALQRPLGAATLGFAYAVSDEIHQHFVRGRSGNVVDVAIDAVGVLAGIALYARGRS